MRTINDLLLFLQENELYLTARREKPLRYVVEIVDVASVGLDPIRLPPPRLYVYGEAYSRAEALKIAVEKAKVEIETQMKRTKSPPPKPRRK